jgi:para-nitrobenzyl esterase
VQRNIRAFGGDPNNVTIAGNSAGGVSVLTHVVSTGARGLFDKAIVQTGDFALTQTPLAEAEETGMRHAEQLGCADQTAACLRSLPVSKLLTIDSGPFGYTPGVLDGKVLTQSIGTALASGDYEHVPMLNGTTRDEERLFTALFELQGAPVTAENYQSRIASRLGVSAAVAAKIAAEYPLEEYSSPPIAYSAAVSDWANACPALEVDRLTSRDVPTFAYEFNGRSAPQAYLPPVSFPYGAFHTSELQYLFDLPTAPISTTLTAPQQELATSMQRYWASFAANGDPNVTGEPQWPAFNADSQRMLSLETPEPHVQSGFAAKHHCDFWGDLN